MTSLSVSQPTTGRDGMPPMPGAVSHAADIPAAGQGARPTAEARAQGAILGLLRGIQEKTWRDYGHAVRAVHAKSHGLLEGELRVLGGLPRDLAQGLFARAGAYPVAMRISTIPGDILDDTVSTPRGMAMKVIGVEGERLPGSGHDATQDFVMVNGPAFVAPDAAGFARSLSLLAATTDTGQGWKKLVSATLRGLVSLRAAVGLTPGILPALGGQPATHPLGETFYSQTPFLYGDRIAKFSLAPVSPALKALTDAPVSLAGRPNGLRQAVIDFFRDHGGEWELRVQLRTNPVTMPIEDASVPWPEDQSPYVAVALVTVPPQPAWNEARARQVDDGLSFSPWHGLAAHRPIGSVNRVRREAYAASAGFRAKRNRCPMHEPSGRVGLSDHPASPYGTLAGREGRRPHTPDARRDHWIQPLNPEAARITAGALGGLAAGALISAMMLGVQAATSRPSELIVLKRRAGRRPGWDGHWERTRSTLGEELLSHGGHLALSAMAGAAYGALKPRGTPPLVAGAAMGVGFHALAYGVAGPVLGVTPKLWEDEPANVAEHGFLHLLFGVTTALVAERVARRF